MMREVYKKYGDESGPNYILDLDGPDGNVYYLWGLIENLIGEDAVEESKIGGHYANPDDCPLEGYECVLDYCLSQLSPSPIGIEFRMHGEEVGQISDYHYAMEQHGVV
jgi:hypothetical protein